MSNDITNALKYANLQVASEAFLIHPETGTEQYSGEGEDILYGGQGDDTLNAEDPDGQTDFLFGGEGNDWLPSSSQQLS